jgi:hypothetical protein
MANRIMKNKCLVIGHYTPLGREIKKRLFPKDYDGLEMSWFIIDGHAHGGRAGLFRMLKYVMLDKKASAQDNNFDLNNCTTDCKTVKGVFFRSCSVITSYKKFQTIS